MSPFFTQQEGAAVMKMLCYIVTADHATPEEIKLLRLFASAFELMDPGPYESLDDIRTAFRYEAACQIISDMGSKKRKLIPFMLGAVVHKDGRHTEGEMERLVEIVNDCDLIIEGINRRDSFIVTMNWLFTCDGIEDLDLRDVKLTVEPC